MRFLVFLLITLSFDSYSIETCKFKNGNTMRGSIACFVPQVKWKLSGGVIKDVCFNYRKGSTEYRRCRMKARDVFKSRCTKAKAAYKKSHSGSNEKKAAYKQKGLYCRTFRP